MSEDAGLVAQREALYKLLPEDLRGEEGTRLYALWSGLAAPLAQAKAWTTALFEQAVIETGMGMWLTLHGKGLGVDRLQDETDAQLRIRMRNTQDRVTPPAILKHVNDLLSTVTEEQAVMLERPQSFVWEESGIDEWPVWWLWNAFVLGLPALPVAENGWAMEEGAMEGAWLEGSKRNGFYTVLETAVRASRAAGITVFYLDKEAEL